MSEDKCKAILKEYQAKGEYQEQVYQRMRASYSHHYRRMVPLLVNMLVKKEDLRALTPLIYSHVTPYGLFRLDLSERMLIEEISSA